MSTVLATATTATVTPPAATATGENLDERMERIRRRNEELEQKHREAEADRLAALRNNAMVVTTRPTADEDDDDEEDGAWPRGHRYDTEDIAAVGGKPIVVDAVDTADSAVVAVDSVAAAAAAAAKDTAAATTVKGPGGRDYKKFADGEGPPPDPQFNFLADAERDGRQRRSAKPASAATAPAAGERNSRDWRTAADEGQPRTRGGLNGSFKQQQQRNIENNNGSARNATKSGKPTTAKPTNAVDAEWRKERQSIDEARIGRQKTGDGRWRREWDNEKVPAGGRKQVGAELLAEKVANVRLGDADVATTAAAGRRIVNNNGVEKQRAGNVTVSVSQDGEVKSVKLQSNRAIGTGRVGGPRPLPLTTPKGAIAIQPHEFSPSAVLAPTFTPSAAAIPAVAAAALPSIQPQPHPYYKQSKPMLPHHTPIVPHALIKPLPIYIQPTPTVYFNNAGSPTTPKSPLPMTTAATAAPADTPTTVVRTPRPNLQDRMSRHRQQQQPAADATG